MPSKTQKQARFMAAAAHNPKFAKRVGIKPGVAKEFNKADTGTKRLSNAMKKKSTRKKFAFGGLAAGMGAMGKRAAGMMNPRQRMQNAALASPSKFGPSRTSPVQPPQGGGMAAMFRRAQQQRQQQGQRGQPSGLLGRFRAQQDQQRQGINPGGPPGSQQGGGSSGGLRGMMQRIMQQQGGKPQGGGGGRGGMMGGLQRLMQQRQQQQRGGPQPPSGGSSPGGQIPGQFGPFNPRGRTDGVSGPVRRPEGPRGAPSGPYRGVPRGRGQNELLRTAGSASNRYGNQLNKMMGRFGGQQRFAEGGKVKSAVAALRRAREMLQDSDPDFDHIANLIGKDIPNGGGIAASIRSASKRKPVTGKPDEFRGAWQKINKKIDALEEALSKAKE